MAAKFEDFTVGTRFTRAYDGHTFIYTAKRLAPPISSPSGHGTIYADDASGVEQSHYMLDTATIVSQPVGKAKRSLTHVTKVQLRKQLEDISVYNKQVCDNILKERAEHSKTVLGLRTTLDKTCAELERIKNIPTYKLNIDLGLKVANLEKELAALHTKPGFYYSDSKKEYIRIEAMESNHLRNALKLAKRNTGKHPPELLAEWNRRGLGLE